MVVYHGCLPSTFLKIDYDGSSRNIGQCNWRMKEVSGITTAGVYVTDRPETECSEVLIPASGGPTGKPGYSGSEVTSDDGTIPMKFVVRCLADPIGMPFRKEKEHNRTFCFMPDALYITRVSFVGQHPHTARWGITHSKWTDLWGPPDTGWCIIFGLKDLFRPWAFSDPERLLCNVDPQNEAKVSTQVFDHTAWYEKVWPGTLG